MPATASEKGSGPIEDPHNTQDIPSPLAGILPTDLDDPSASPPTGYSVADIAPTGPSSILGTGEMPTEYLPNDDREIPTSDTAPTGASVAPSMGGIHVVPSISETDITPLAPIAVPNLIPSPAPAPESAQIDTECYGFSQPDRLDLDEHVVTPIDYDELARLKAEIDRSLDRKALTPHSARQLLGEAAELALEEGVFGPLASLGWDRMFVLPNGIVICNSREPTEFAAVHDGINLDILPLDLNVGYNSGPDDCFISLPPTGIFPTRLDPRPSSHKLAIGNTGFKISATIVPTTNATHDFTPDDEAYTPRALYDNKGNPPRGLPIVEQALAYREAAIGRLRERNRALYKAGVYVALTDQECVTNLKDIFGTDTPKIGNITNPVMYKFRKKLFAGTEAFSNVSRPEEPEYDYGYNIDLRRLKDNKPFLHMLKAARDEITAKGYRMQNP